MNDHERLTDMVPGIAVAVTAVIIGYFVGFHGMTFLREHGMRWIGTLLMTGLVARMLFGLLRAGWRSLTNTDVWRRFHDNKATVVTKPAMAEQVEDLRVSGGSDPLSNATGAFED